MAPGPHDAHHEHEHPAPGEGRDALQGQADIGSVEAVRHDAALETSERGDYEAVQHAADHRVAQIETQTGRQQIEAQQRLRLQSEAYAAGRRVIGRASSRIEQRGDAPQAEDEIARAEAYHEALHEEYEASQDFALQRIAEQTLRNASPEEVQAHKEKLAQFFIQYADAYDPTGLNNFHRRLDKAYAQNDVYELDEIYGEMTDAFGPKAITILEQVYRDKEVRAAMFDMWQAHLLLTAAHSDPQRFLSTIEYYSREGGQTTEHYAAIRRSFAASRSTELRAAVDFAVSVEEQTVAAETVEIVEETSIEDALQAVAETEEAEPEEEEEVPEESEETTEGILEALDATEEQMSRIPEEGQEAVAEMVRDEGGGIVLGALFTGDFSVGEGNVSGEIAGSEVELDFGTRQLAIRGHETGTRYPLPGLRPEHYDITRLFELGMEDAHLSLGQKESFAAAFAYTVADLDVRDSELMRERDAHRYHKYMGLLLGRGVDADVELTRLRRLGALADGDTAVPSRLQELASAIAHYVPTEGEGGIHGGGPVEYEDFVTLADLWEEGGFALPELAELKELTAERLEQEHGS